MLKHFVHKTCSTFVIRCKVSENVSFSFKSECNCAKIVHVAHLLKHLCPNVETVVRNWKLLREMENFCAKFIFLHEIVFFAKMNIFEQQYTFLCKSDPFRAKVDVFRPCHRGRVRCGRLNFAIEVLAVAPPKTWVNKCCDQT